MMNEAKENIAVFKNKKRENKSFKDIRHDFTITTLTKVNFI